MSAHDPHHDTHDEALSAFLAEAPDEATALRTAFESSPWAGCASCRERIEEHLTLARRLDALGHQEREERVAQPVTPTAPGRAEAALRERLMGREQTLPPRAPSRRPPSWAWLAALAAGLLVFVWLRSGERRVDPGPVLGTGLVLEHPVGEVESLTPFTWQGEDPGAGWYRIQVWPEGGTPPLDSGPLHTTSWSPSPEALQGCSRIRWRVELYGGAGDGDLLDAKDEWAQLSSH